MILDTQLSDLEAQGTPIRIGLIGAGYAAAGFALQCLKTPGMRLTAVVNRTADTAHKMLRDLGIKSPKIIKSPADIRSLDKYTIGYTDDPLSILNSKEIDVIVEATGDVSYGAFIAIGAITSHKHIINVNAELDCTLGPILKIMADGAGVIYAQADGDQPAVLMNLIREMRMLGLKPVLAGNIKTVFDRYRTPKTQKKWARAHNQSPILATAAVDGTKLACEMSSVANAAGLTISTRGMQGLKIDHVEKAADAFNMQKILKQGGAVDFIWGAEPSFGVFVVGHTVDTLRREYLKMYKLGNGPFYTLYRPYHLCTLEAHLSVARAYFMNDAALAPTSLKTEVVAVAKHDLKKGESLDGIGGFDTYGVIEKSSVVQREGLLPIGLSRDCTIRTAIAKDTPVRFQDVNVPKGRLIDKLYKRQIRLFSTKSHA